MNVPSADVHVQTDIVTVVVSRLWVPSVQLSLLVSSVHWWVSLAWERRLPMLQPKEVRPVDVAGP